MASSRLDCPVPRTSSTYPALSAYRKNEAVARVDCVNRYIGMTALSVEVPQKKKNDITGVSLHH